MPASLLNTFFTPILHAGAGFIFWSGHIKPEWSFINVCILFVAKSVPFVDHYSRTFVVTWHDCGLVMVPAAKKCFSKPHESRVKGSKNYSYQKSPGRVSAHHPLHSAHWLVGESTWRMHRATRDSRLADFEKLWVFRWVLSLTFSFPHVK